MVCDIKRDPQPMWHVSRFCRLDKSVSRKLIYIKNEICLLLLTNVQSVPIRNTSSILPLSLKGEIIWCKISTESANSGTWISTLSLCSVLININHHRRNWRMDYLFRAMADLSRWKTGHLKGTSPPQPNGRDQFISRRTLQIT